VLLQMRHLVLRRQRREQLAVGPRRKAIGVGEKNLLRHTGQSMGEKRALIVRKTVARSNDHNGQEWWQEDQKIAAFGSSYGCTQSNVGAGEACDLLTLKPHRAGGFSPNGTTAMVNRDTQLALPSSLVKRISHTWVVRPI